jgi:putative ABC transport system permease protein
MVRHYLAFAFANIARAPVTTAAKVLTLALGLVAMIAVSGIVAYWRSSDSQITPAGGRTLVFTTSIRAASGGLRVGAMPRTPPVLAKYLREDVPELTSIARFTTRRDVPVDTGDRAVILNSANADPGILDIFRFNFVAGDPKTAMQREDGIILTQDSAQKLFGNAPALDRRLVLGGQRNVVVTGVIGPIPKPSQFVDGDIFGLGFDYVTVMPPDSPGREQWSNLSLATFGLLPSDGSLSRSELDGRLAALTQRRAPLDDDGTPVFGAAGVEQSTELFLNAALFRMSSGVVSVVGVFSGLGLLVLGVACLNYANLATAQAVAGAKEIGMRRVMGAGLSGVLLQSWIEAGLVTLAALALTGICLWLAAPVIDAQTGIDLVGALSRDPSALAGIGGVAAAVTLVAGLYPAFVVSRVRPVEALRAGKVRSGPRGIAQVLVGLQFASASVLLTALIIVGQQNAHMRSLALDRSADPVVVLPPQSRSGVAIDTLRQQLAAYPQIKAIGEVRQRPWGPDDLTTRLARSPDPADEGKRVTDVDVGFEYFDVHDQKVLAGRVFMQDSDRGAGAALPASPGQPPPVRQIVIDRVFSEQLGFASPQAAIGQLLYSETPRYEIIGVVETRLRQIQSSGDGGTIYELRANFRFNSPLIRIGANDVDGGLAAIRRVWDQLALEGAPDLQFEDQAFDQSFRTFERVGLLFLALSLLAFVISSIGLFGMAVHVTQRRMHEIGVRKTLGSSTGAIAGLLLSDFSKPVIIANLLAWPLAWVAAQIYLSPFAERIEIGPLPFLLSLVITLVIAWLAVGGQTLRAAMIQPTEVLRRA